MESATVTRPRPGSAWLARMMAVPASSWAKLGLGLLAAGALTLFLVFPTYPNYDSYYYLLWGRDVVHLHAPTFTAYRAPTEHPLAIAFGALLSLVGQDADRLLILATIASYLALAAGLYRLSRLAFTPLVGAITVVLLCTRFEFPFFTARGYVDIPYMALVVWAAALELERPRRGVPVFGLLAAAGLLRPEAWVLAGLYFLWCAAPASWAQRARYAALAASAPVLWACVDGAVTGDPLFSLHSTSDLADKLGRAKGLTAIPSSMWNFLVRLDHAPVILAGAAGLALAAWFAPRRIVMPAVLLASGLGTFIAVGFLGLSVINRYLLVPSLMVMVFAAVAIGGWTMLEPGSWLRRVWMLGAVALALYSVIFAATTLSLSSVKTQLGFRGDSHAALAGVLRDPRVQAGLKCGPLSVPDHKLIPDARWVLGGGASGVIARSQARTRADRGDRRLLARIQRGVALYPTGAAVDQQALVEVTDDPRDQVPLAGFQRTVTSQYYAAYVRC